mgnify:CR=1 FL=1
MAGRTDRGLRGIAAPLLVGEPLFVRLCSAFVENLALILRGAFIVGALLLVRDFGSITDNLSPPVADTEPVVAAPAIAAEQPESVEPQEPVVSDRVRHFLNCTYEEYRAQNYAECVNEPSGIYRAPEAGPDDTGSLFRQTPVRYVYVVDHPMPRPARAGCGAASACTSLL